MKRLYQTFLTLSPMAQIGLVLGLLAVMALLYFAVSSRSYNQGRESLKEENRALQSKYDAAIGEKNAYRLEAAESKMKADAVLAAIENKKTDIKQVDDKLKEVEKKYETAKANMGDCGDTVDECTKRLCKELAAAGFKVTCTAE
jgi:chromosome segregation ATPase